MTVNCRGEPESRGAGRRPAPLTVHPHLRLRWDDARMAAPECPSEVTPSLLRTLVARLRTNPIRPLVAVASSLGVVALVARPGLLGGGLGKGFDALTGANTSFFWVAGVGFIISLIASSLTWKTALDSCGARLSAQEACARYGVGSLVNTVAPMRLGDVARVVLFSRTLKQDRDRVLTAGGALGAVSAVRALVQAVLVAVAAVIGALPLWPVAALAGLALCVVPIAFLARRRLPQRRIAHLLRAFHALARSPRRAFSLLGWTTVAAVARVIAATAITSSLGLPWSLGTGLIITVALDLATTIPLTPGNLGIATGAVALALQSRGVPLTTAVASGLAFHAVEVVAGLAFGGAGALALARFPSPGARRLGLRVAGAAAGILVVTGVTASVLPSLA